MMNDGPNGYVLPGKEIIVKSTSKGQAENYPRKELIDLLKKGRSYDSILKKYGIGIEQLSRIKITDYTNEEIADLIAEGKPDEYFVRYDLSRESLTAIKANVSMGSYKQSKKKCRDLDSNEVREIYLLLSNKAPTEDIAKKFNTTRIRIMGFKASYTKKINSGMDLEGILLSLKKEE